MSYKYYYISFLYSLILREGIFNCGVIQIMELIHLVNFFNFDKIHYYSKSYPDNWAHSFGNFFIILGKELSFKCHLDYWTHYQLLSIIWKKLFIHMQGVRLKCELIFLTFYNYDNNHFHSNIDIIRHQN